MTLDHSPSRVRNIARDAVRGHVTSTAIALFAEYGFDNVTIDQIAESAGISRRSFHRYFAAKEDVIVGEPQSLGSLVRDALLARPVDEPVWTSLRLAYASMLRLVGDDRGQDRQTVHLLTTTPSLRARNLEKHLLWARMLTPIVEERLTGMERDVRAQSIVHASLACLDVSLATWADTEGGTVDEALRRTFAALTETSEV